VAVDIGSRRTSALVVPVAGVLPPHQAPKAERSSGQTDEKLAARILTMWMTSLDHRPAITFVTEAKPLRNPRRSARTPGRYARFAFVAADGVLKVGEPGAVLDVKQGSACEIPGEEVRPARELVVLVWLVECDGESMAAHSGREQLAHRRVDRIFGAAARRALAWVDEIKPSLETERNGNGRVGLEAGRAATLDGMNHRRGDAGSPS
jgi:hypothetical protein